MVPQTIAIRRSRDKAIHISESVLTDLLLDNSGLNRQERLMVLTAMSGSSATQDAETSLIKMHNRIHTLERRQSTAKGGRGKDSGHPRKGDKGRGKGKGYGKGSKKGTSYSYLSAVEDLFDDYPDAGEDDDGTAYLAGQEGQDGQGGENYDWVYHGDDGHVDGKEDDTDLVAQTADASLRDVELDVFTSFLSAEGFDETDPCI